MSTLHHDELDLDPGLVRALVDRTDPSWSWLPLTPFASTGSTNALFRLGEDLLVRLPRQPGGSATIAKEARWLPVIGPALPVRVPKVVAVGEPGFGYPEQWSVRWIDGSPPGIVDPGVPAGADLTGLATDLADAVAALRESLRRRWATRSCGGTAESRWRTGTPSSSRTSPPAAGSRTWTSTWTP